MVDDDQVARRAATDSLLGKVTILHTYAVNEYFDCSPRMMIAIDRI